MPDGAIGFFAGVLVMIMLFIGMMKGCATGVVVPNVKEHKCKEGVYDLLVLQEDGSTDWIETKIRCKND